LREWMGMGLDTNEIENHATTYTSRIYQEISGYVETTNWRILIYI